MHELDFGAPQALPLATRLLLEEQVLIVPTDTLYGFSALADSETALQRIESLKGIPRRRSLLALIERFESLEPFLHAEQERRGLAALRRSWPAALTVVLRVREALPWGDASGTLWTAAFRVPGHARLRALLSSVGRPLVSTSVNHTGAEPARHAPEIRDRFGREQDLTFFRDRGLEQAGALRGSTVVDATRWPPLLLRQGGCDFAAFVAAGEAGRMEDTPAARTGEG